MGLVSIFSQGKLTVGAVQKMRQAEYQALSELEKSCADRRLARKAKIVLLAHQGWSSTMISREVGVSARQLKRL